MTAILTLCALIVLVMIVPARFDPAIRLKEWNDRQGRGS